MDGVSSRKNVFIIGHQTDRTRSTLPSCVPDVWTSSSTSRFQTSLRVCRFSRRRSRSRPIAADVDLTFLAKHTHGSPVPIWPRSASVQPSWLSASRSRRILSASANAWPPRRPTPRARSRWRRTRLLPLRRRRTRCPRSRVPTLRRRCVSRAGPSRRRHPPLRAVCAEPAVGPLVRHLVPLPRGPEPRPDRRRRRQRCWRQRRRCFRQRRRRRRRRPVRLKALAGPRSSVPRASAHRFVLKRSQF